MDLLFGESKRDSLELLSKVPPTLSASATGIGVLSFEALTLSTFEAGKKTPGKHRWDGKNLRFELNETTLAFIKRTWPNVIVLKDATPQRREAKPAEIMETMFYRERVPAFDHQKTAFRLGCAHAAFAYLMDRGTGKSKSGVDDAAFHFARGEIDRVLVVAPNGVHIQWIEDGTQEKPGVLAAHWPLELPCRKDVIITGDKKPDWWGDWTRDPRDCKWLAVNAENLRVVKRRARDGSPFWEFVGLAAEVAEFLKAGPAMLIWDESHKGKDPHSVIATTMTKLGRLAAYRRIMTGSPLAKGPEDYYSQFKFLDPNIIGCQTWTGFKQQFCIEGGFSGREVVGYRATEELHARIAGYSYQVRKEDVLDLPPKMYTERLVELTPAQKRVYNQLRDELLADMSDGTILEAGQVTTRMLRLQQVVMGYLPLEAGGFDEYPDNRLPSLIDFLRDGSGRAVVWCRFTRDIERVLDALGRDACVRWDGHEKRSREGDKAAWLAPSSGKQFFIGNAAAGGTGLDWINGGPQSPLTVVYYSNSFSSIDRWQSEDRTHRIGTKGTVTYTDMIARGTIDRAVLRNLKGKKEITSMSLTELREIIGEW